MQATTIPEVPIMIAFFWTNSLVTVKHPFLQIVKSFFTSICRQLIGTPCDVFLQHDSGILSLQSCINRKFYNKLQQKCLRKLQHCLQFVILPITNYPLCQLRVPYFISIDSATVQLGLGLIPSIGDWFVIAIVAF